MNLYDLGILWAIGSYSDKQSGTFSFRHRDKFYLERMDKYFSNKVYKQKRVKNKDGIQYVLKTRKINVESLTNFGWSERNSSIRNLPELLDYKDFLRAYVEIHSRLDYSTRYKKRTKYKALRLRTYGNVHLINSVNIILHNNAGAGIKTVEVLKNNKTSIINYTTYTEIESIYNWLFGYPNNKKYWEDVKIKLEQPTKDY